MNNSTKRDATGGLKLPSLEGSNRAIKALRSAQLVNPETNLMLEEQLKKFIKKLKN